MIAPDVLAEVPPLLDGLNEAQRAAVAFGEGPVLVLAGAGTGKTRVLTRRIAWLIGTRRARPSEILALTFTEKAAQEMEERVDALVPFGFADTTIATFHAFGRRLLDEFGMLLGLPGSLRVLTQAESVVFLRERLWELPLSRLRPIGDPTRHLAELVRHFGRLSDEDVPPAAYAAFAARARADAEARGDEAALERAALWTELSATYARVQELLAAAGLVDFAGLLSLSLRLVREHPAVREELSRRYRWLLVDEFQDTNTAQFELVRAIGGRTPNLTVVGDDDQSIYRFRGAAISNILGFRDAYPAAATFVLVENHRSTQPILDAARRLIRHNDPERLEVQAGVDKRLVARGPRPDGPPVEHVAFDTPSSEADWIAARIAGEVAAGRRAWGDFAVLVRRHAAAAPVAGALALRSIPFRVAGGGGLFDRAEVAACVEALRAIADPGDDRAFYFLASGPVYDVPVLDLARLAGRARRVHRTLEDVVRARLAAAAAGAAPGDESGAALERLAALVRDLDALRPYALAHGTGETLYRFLHQSGYLPRLAAGGSAEADEQVRNLARLFDLARGFAGIAARDRVLEFVLHLELLREAGENPRAAEPDLEDDAVHVLTVHRAKGLEFPVVFLPGLEANHFPGVNRRDPLPFPEALLTARLPGGDFHRAEERRLFYVGMTRAREELWLSSATDHGGPRRWKTSPFVLEALDRPDPVGVRAGRSSALEQVQRNAARPAAAALELRPLAADAPLALSHRQIDDYRTCPLKFKFAHVLAVPLLPHHSVGYGVALHAAIRDFYTHRAEGWPLDEAEIVRSFERHWSGEGFITREHEETRREQGREAIRAFFRRELAAPSRPAHVEVAFELEHGATTVRGRLDRVDVRPAEGGAVIVDFKSSDVTDRAKADQRAAESLQLALYARAWKATRTPPPVAVELHYIRSGVVGRAPVTDEGHARAEAAIEGTARGVRARAFAATPSYGACGHCPYNAICPSRARGPF
jgi:DNA helicase-2/ATP-dependent DNA helicase PcrA